MDMVDIPSGVISQMMCMDGNPRSLNVFFLYVLIGTSLPFSQPAMFHWRVDVPNSFDENRGV